MANALGTYGIWRPSGKVTADLASELEALGFGALWLGGSPGGDLKVAEDLLDASERIVVATGIVNMWTDDATSIASAYHRIVHKHPGRFLLGVGVGHPEATAAYQKPYAKIVGYLDELDRADVPQADLALAALGPQVLRLAGERTAGAHPYLTTPEHTQQAREILGEQPLLAPEHKVVLESDPQRAREIGRSTVASPYLGLTNYRNSLLRTGWTEQDLADGGSDALIDALVAHGSVEDIAAGPRAHRDAGADHVAIQVLGEDPAPAYRALADVLELVA